MRWCILSCSDWKDSELKQVPNCKACSEMSSLRITFISGRELDYPRNNSLLHALKLKGYVVRTTHVSSRSILLNTALGMLSSLIDMRQTDLFIAGFLGQPLAVLISRLNKPLILDALVSVYETLCEDRVQFKESSLMAKIAFWMDSYSMRKSSCIITDTDANARFLSQRFYLPLNKFGVVYIGCDESLFHPTFLSSTLGRGRHITVFTYNSFLPLHGTSVIIEAASLLKHRSDISFVIGGMGMQFEKIKELISSKKIGNVKLIGWIPYERLPVYINKADICLGGHFSSIPKAHRSLSTKTFQFMAMQKATIVGEGEAARELLRHRVDAFFVPPSNPIALANAIEELADDVFLRHQIAEQAFLTFKRKFSVEAISQQLAKIVSSAVCESV